VPYALFVYSGIVFWYFFADTVMDIAASIRNDAAVIQKVYFPRLISPLVSLLANSFLLGIALLPAIGLMIYYGFYPGARILLLPVVFVQLCMLVFGLGCMFAAITVTNRDWERLLNFALYIGLFVSPVLYSTSMIPQRFHVAYAINPMVGSLDALRSALFAEVAWPTAAWSYSLAFSALVCMLGLAVFQRAEKYFVDKL
jgi:lipopolysaccharide transport system permease protein